MALTVEMGNRIKKQRELLGITREEIAEQLGITPRFYYDLELGNKGMSIATMTNICNVLHLSCDYILFGNTNDTDDYEALLALIKACPVEKRKYLSELISVYLKSI